jgi:hypothetical protein
MPFVVGLVLLGAALQPTRLPVQQEATGELRATVPVTGWPRDTIYSRDASTRIWQPGHRRCGGRSRPGTPLESGAMYVAFAVPKTPGSK